MVHKRYKNDAANELLRKETNIHFINPSTRKIDLKMFTRHLCEKDEYANYEIEHNMLDDSSYSDNPLLSVLNNGSDADGEDSADEKKPCFKKNTNLKRKVRQGTYNIVEYNGRKIKAKHRYSAWFMLYIENPDLQDDNFLKDFCRRFRLPYYSYKDLLSELK